MNDKSLRDMMKNKKASPENLTQEQKAQFEMLKEKVDKYKDKDVSELMREIDRLKLDKDVVSKLKGRELDTFANSLKPVLSDQQKRKLDDLVKYLRNG
jgi:hypothetical protein